MKRWIICAGILSTSCATPAVKVEPQIVYLEKPVPCVTEGELPEKPKPLEPRPERVAAALDLAIAKLVDLLGPKLDGSAGYVGKVEHILRGVCKGE